MMIGSMIDALMIESCLDAARPIFDHQSSIADSRFDHQFQFINPQSVHQIQIADHQCRLPRCAP